MEINQQLIEYQQYNGKVPYVICNQDFVLLQI
jgi:hypothetical protein